jgi:iron complex transport system ATP-binding protein
VRVQFEPQETVISTDDLTVGYRTSRTSRDVLTNLTLSLRRGELACVLGPNGAGKSTLMRTMAGMQRPLAGTVRLGAADLHGLPARTLARRLAVVLTERVSPGLLSGYELVALGRHPFTDWTGRLTDQDHRAVQRAICAVGAEPLAGRLVAELSDGERQKIMIARALAQEPEVMILDEITAFLDLPRRVEIMGILKQLAHDEGRTILLSTHDLDLALHTADTLWLVNGATVIEGIPEELVLMGAFESAFASEGVSFDRDRGAFRVAHHGRGTIGVDGDSVLATWTRRALERRGFEVGNAETSALRVRVDGTVENGHWLVSGEGPSEMSCSSLKELLDRIAPSP